MVVVNETVLVEAAAFPGFFNKNIFEELGLKYGTMGIVSVTQFENIIASGELEKFARECEKSLEDNPDNIRGIRQVKEALNLGFEPYARDLSFWDQAKYNVIDELD